MLDRGNPTYSTTYRFLRLDGREIWFQDTSKADFDPAGKLVRIKGMGLDVTERNRAEDHQKTLIAELDHRVKNLLARVAAVVMYTREGGGSNDDFAQALDRRIQSMADAHLLLSESRWQGVDLLNLVEHQLAPYTNKANITIEGPQVALTAVATQAVAMVLHELVTNAVKYGALSRPVGQVAVSWMLRANGGAPKRVIVEWRETGGPPVAAPARFSYGTSLIRDLIPHELGGTAELLFPIEGVRCRIEFPL
jgi:two-component sensor histidine kinase